jgi:hypothetical protein
MISFSYIIKYIFFINLLLLLQLKQIDQNKKTLHIYVYLQMQFTKKTLIQLVSAFL